MPPPITRSLPSSPSNTVWRHETPNVAMIDTTAPVLTTKKTMAPASAAPTLAYPGGACCPCNNANTSVPRATEATTRPTLKADHAMGRRRILSATTMATANTSTVREAGTSRTSSTKKASSTSMASGPSATSRVMGQMKPAAMRTQKAATNAMTVAVGAPAESVCRSATVAASRPATAHMAATARVDGPRRMAAAGRIPSAVTPAPTARSRTPLRTSPSIPPPHAPS